MSCTYLLTYSRRLKLEIFVANTTLSGNLFEKFTTLISEHLSDNDARVLSRTLTGCERESNRGCVGRSGPWW